MKKNISIFFAFLALSLPICLAQSTTVSATVTDPSGQTWNNGTISYVFQPAPGVPGPYYWNGAQLPAQYLTPQVVQLNGAAYGTWSIPTSTSIAPAGSYWQYQVTPDATSPSITVNQATTGSTQNISAVITSTLANLTIPATNLPKAYADSEIKVATNQGALYYNVTGNVVRVYSGSAWSTLGGAVCDKQHPDVATCFGAKGTGRNNGYSTYAGTGVTFAPLPEGVDGNTTASSNILYSPAANFTSGYVGLTIKVFGAGTAGVNLTTTIASVLNAHNITLTAAPQMTMTGASYFISRTDGAMTLGSATLTSTSANFTQAYVAQFVTVPGAGSAGATLYAQIVSVPDSTHIILSVVAGTAVTGASYQILASNTIQASSFFTASSPNMAGMDIVIANVGALGLNFRAAIVKLLDSYGNTCTSSCTYAFLSEKANTFPVSSTTATVYGNTYDGAVSGTSITSVSMNFTSADVGKNIWVSGAGAAGVSLATTILSVQSSTTATLNTTATMTLATSEFVIGDDDTSAINAGIAAMTTGGVTSGTLSITGRPNSCYIVSDRLWIANANNFTLSGIGLPKICLVGTSGHQIGVIYGDNGTGTPLYTTVTNLTFSGLEIAGDGVTADQHAGIINGSGTTIKNLRIEKNYIHDVSLGATVNADLSGSVDGFWLQNNRIENIAGSGIGQYGITHSNGSGLCSNGHINFNSFRNIARIDVYEAKGCGVEIIGNTSFWHGANTVQSSPIPSINCCRGKNITIANNTIAYSLNGSVQVGTDDIDYPTRDVLVTGNNVYEPRGPHAAFTLGNQDPADLGESDMILSNNASFGSLNYGGGALTIFSGKHLTVSNNSFTNVNGNGGGLVTIYGSSETVGTNKWTSDLSFTGNTLRQANASGSAYGFVFEPSASLSSIDAVFKNNDVKISSGSPFYLSAGNASYPGTIQTAQTSSISATTFYTTAVEGYYLPSMSLYATSAGTGTTDSVTGTLSCTGCTASSTSAVSLDQLGGYSQASITDSTTYRPIHLSAGIALKYATTVTGASGGAYAVNAGVGNFTTMPLTSTQAPTVYFTASVAGYYTASLSVTVTTAGSAGTVNAALISSRWGSISTGPISLSTISLQPGGSQKFTIYMQVSDTISYSSTVAGAAGSPAYQVTLSAQADLSDPNITVVGESAQGLPYPLLAAGSSFGAFNSSTNMQTIYNNDQMTGSGNGAGFAINACSTGLPGLVLGDNELTQDVCLTRSGANTASLIGGLTATGPIIGQAPTGTYWKPTDQSGGNLTFSTADAYYTKVGNIVYVNGRIVYPATADTNQVNISLPFTSANYTNSYFAGFILSNYAAIGSPSLDWLVAPNSNTFGVYITPGLGTLTNAAISGKLVLFNFNYATQ